jgi:uridine kinase
MKKYKVKKIFNIKNNSSLITGTHRMDSDAVITDHIKRGLFAGIANGVDSGSVIHIAMEHVFKIAAPNKKIVSIVGGAGSGKSTLTKYLIERYPAISFAVLITDSFSIGTRQYRRQYLENGDPVKKYNFDLLKFKVRELLSSQAGQMVSVPIYNEDDGAGVPLAAQSDPQADSSEGHYCTAVFVGPIDILVVEGDFQPLEKTDFIIYIHLSDQQRCKNRIARDLTYRGETDIQLITRSFEKRQILQHMPYTLPVAECADLLVWGKVSRSVTDQDVYSYDVYIKNPKPK